MVIRALFDALSGVRSSGRQLQASSHNVANLLTEDFHPVHTVQSELREGGSRVEAQRSANPEPVDLAGEFVDQSLAGLQLRASLRVIDTGLDLLGEISDVGRESG